MTWISAGLGIGAALTASYFAARGIYDDVYERWMKRQVHKAKLSAYQRRQELAALLHVQADANGRLGALVRSDRSSVNLDTRANQTERLLLAAQGRTPDEAIQAMLPETIHPLLPRQISLQEVLGTRTPSLDALTLGVTLDDSGQMVPVTKSLYELMHLLAIGITGTGKSTWLLSILAQIEMCTQPIEVLLIDVHGSAFNLCSDWSKLRYPIAGNNQEAKLLLEAVRAESDRRSALYKEVKLAEDLASYNAHAEEPLHPWFLLIDEGTLMLADSSISGYVASVVQGTRQYGLYVFMTGQTGNATVIKSPIRANFPTRVCYTTERPSMAAALGSVPDGDLEEIPGRAWMRLKGRSTSIKVQAPYIRREAFYNMIEHEGPKYLMPEAPEEDPTFSDKHILDTWGRLPKKNKSALCRALGGEPVGGFFYKVDTAAIRLGLWEATVK